MSNMGDNKPDDASSESASETPTVSGRLPSGTEEALLDYGKQLILKSAETSLDFHKTMLASSATFGTLITTLTPILIFGVKDAAIPLSEGWIVVLPQLAMLASAIVFALGYFPGHDEISVDVVQDIKNARKKVIRRRRVLAKWGLGLFCLALLLTIIVSIRLRSLAV